MKEGTLRRQFTKFEVAPKRGLAPREPKSHFILNFQRIFDLEKFSFCIYLTQQILIQQILHSADFVFSNFRIQQILYSVGFLFSRFLFSRFLFSEFYIQRTLSLAHFLINKFLFSRFCIQQIFYSAKF